MNTKKVLVAGATGYLGQYLVKELKKRGCWVRVLIRKEAQKEKFKDVDDFFVGQITEPNSLKGITNNIDWVFSTVGITRQKDGLTYMDVDYQGNSNLLKEALKDKVEAFQYISAINGDKLRHLKIFEAKERFVDELKKSGINYCVLRPNGFFSDMKDFLKMAKAVRISHIPDWIRRFTIWLLRTFTSSKTYGPVEFFLTAMAFDNIANQYGVNHLEDFFRLEVKNM